ncbi:MAG TPA: tRNA pseudouridine(38-40) synthase TruA [Symbiobacteriaceae bacterium]|nr:tRNA pseudouridine(38-40) synthase TruA [Symbiobacteriaceae bacterium]
MPTIKLTLQYDGTRYAGFQRQPNGVTIQEKLENALRRTTGDEALKIGAAAGRTDAGVHARGQVVHFLAEARIPVDRWPYALNQHLPEDVVVVAAELAPADFHARYWALSKRYRYTIEHAPFQSPMSRLYAHHWAKELNFDLMLRAAALIEGEHDFAAFRSTGGAAKTSVRTVSRLTVTRHAPYIWIDITADGFLYNMVRIIAGTLLEAGAGRRTLDAVQGALRTGQRSLAGKTLPAHGLCLEEVIYGNGPKRPAWEQADDLE